MFEPNTIAFQSLIVLVAPNFLGLSATGENGFMRPLTPMLHGAGIFTSKLPPQIAQLFTSTFTMEHMG